MNPEQILDRLKTLYASLSKRQLITIAATFVGVVGLLVIWAYWLNAPDYRLLFSDMDADSAAQVIQKLKAEKISYELSDDGHAIKVPAAKLDELRIDLSAQGLPATGRIGFEIFDRTQFGQTDFLEHVNYRRALEGELERTIATLREVESARVHIAMAKDSLFTDRQQPAKASIVLKLRRRGDISQATVNGIANMVSAAVEGLKPDAVVILDSFGRQLNRSGNDDDGLSGPQLDRQRDIEHELSARVVRLLEPIVGIDKVRVNVAATLNPSSQEETDEHWDPNSVVRSRQVTTDARGGSLTGGIAGARANEPPPLPPAAASASANPKTPPPPQPASLAAATDPAFALPQNVTHSSETTNYEISKVTRHSVTPGGEIARLSVAVILDDQTQVTHDKSGKTVQTEKPLTSDQLQKIQSLVSSAVGLDTTRGDRLTVENMPFEETPMDTGPAPTVAQRYMKQIVIGVAVSVVLLLGLIGFLAMRSRSRKRRKALVLQTAAQAAGGAPGQAPRTIQDMESEIEAQLDAVSRGGEPRKLPVLTKRVGGMVGENPRAVAQLLRSWIAEDQR
jgi:flagellar M-ring protein FliF